MILDKIQTIKDLIRGRTFAYNQVFNRQSPFTDIVLKDLAKFCRAHDSTYHKDARIHAALEGRREVFLRIQEYLELSEAEIYALHKIKDMNKEDLK